MPEAAARESISPIVNSRASRDSWATQSEPCGAPSRDTDYQEGAWGFYKSSTLYCLTKGTF